MSRLRVAITTTSDNSDRIARPVADAGMMPIPLPCIRVVPASRSTLRRLRRAAANADWILLTSARAVAITWPGRDMPPSPRVAAVGEATAEAATAAGGRVALIGSGGASAIRDVLRGEVHGRVVVFPHARAADPDLVDVLRSAGAEVIAGAAYATEPIPPADEPVDAVILGSPSAVDGWLSARTLHGLTVAAMGETTAAAIRRRGFEPDIVPSEPGIEPIVDALAALGASPCERSHP